MNNWINDYINLITFLTNEHINDHYSFALQILVDRIFHKETNSLKKKG
jgi:hypothetical protein